MPKYKYEGNRAGTDGTTSIILETDPAGRATKTLTLGEEKDISYAQFLSLKDLFVLTEVTEQVVTPHPRPVLVKSEDKAVAPATDRS